MTAGLPAQDVAHAQSAVGPTEAGTAEATESITDQEGRRPVGRNADGGVLEGVLQAEVTRNGEEGAAFVKTVVAPELGSGATAEVPLQPVRRLNVFVDQVGAVDGDGIVADPTPEAGVDLDGTGFGNEGLVAGRPGVTEAETYGRFVVLGYYFRLGNEAEAKGEGNNTKEVFHNRKSNYPHDSGV